MTNSAKDQMQTNEIYKAQEFFTRLSDLERIIMSWEKEGKVDEKVLKEASAALRESSSAFAHYIQKIEKLEQRFGELDQQIVNLKQVTSQKTSDITVEASKVARSAEQVLKQTVKLWDSDTTRQAIKINGYGGWAVTIILAIALAAMVVKMVGAETIFLEAWKAMLSSIERIVSK